MFSLFKKVSTTPEVALQELNEGQLTQVAGGYGDGDHDADDMKPKHHHHKHKHHHHHHHHHYTSSTHSWSSHSKW